ncbi:MAG: GntR family transcriptional regulator [Atribacterota bacterium]
MAERQLNRRVPIPLYYQLKEMIKEQIEDGSFQAGDLLPSERELSERYGISRPTVRQAIKDLVYEGFLVREKGRGTYVSKPKINYGFIQRFVTFYDDMAQHGLTVKTKVLRREIREAGKKIARFLNLDPQDQIIFLERLRFVEDEPVVRVQNHIPYRLCPELLKEDLSDRSLYHLLSEKYGLKPHRAEIALEAMVADEVDASFLGIKVGAPILLMENITFTEGGIPMDFFQSRFRGDKGRVKVEVMGGL